MDSTVISSDSRYVDGSLVTFSYKVGKKADGRNKVAVTRRFPKKPTNIKVVSHIWTEGDRMDLLAARFYGKPELWWKIMDLNPLLTDPNNIRIGTVINLPDRGFNA